MNIEGLLRNAIQEQLCIEVNYFPGRRILEPHAFGISSEGNRLLRAFQTSGASSTGEHMGWKLMRVDRIENIVVLSSTFQSPRLGYRKGDSAMKGGILAQL